MSALPELPQPDPAAERPRGLGLSITGLVLAVLLAPVGALVSLVALIRARRGKGLPRTLAIVGLIVGVVLSALGAVIAFAVIVPLFLAGQQTARDAQFCSDFTNGGYEPMDAIGVIAQETATVENFGIWRPDDGEDAAAIREYVVDVKATAAVAPDELRDSFDAFLVGVDDLAIGLDPKTASSRPVDQARIVLEDLTASYDRIDSFCTSLSGSTPGS